MKAPLFLIFLLVTSVTLVNFSYAEKKFDVDGDGIADIRASEEIKADLKAKLKTKNNKEVKAILAEIEEQEAHLEKLLQDSPSPQEVSAHAARITSAEEALKNTLWDAEKLLDSQDNKKKNKPDKSSKDKKLKKETINKSPKKEKINKNTDNKLQNDIKSLYRAAIALDEFGATFNKANEYELKTLKKLSSTMTEVYSKSKSPNDKKLGDEIKNKIKDANSDKKQLTTLSDESKSIVKSIAKLATDGGIKKTELDKLAKTIKAGENPNSKNTRIDPKLVGNLELSTREKEELGKLFYDLESAKQKLDREFDGTFGSLLSKDGAAKQMDSDAPPESILDDLDQVIRGPDVNEPKSSKDQKADSKSQNQNKPPSESILDDVSDQSNSDAPPESIMDDVDTRSGPDAKSLESEKLDKEYQKMQQRLWELQEETWRKNSTYRHPQMKETIGLDGKPVMVAVEEDGFVDMKALMEVMSSTNNAAKKTDIVNTKTNAAIQKDLIKLPETKTEIKPKSEVKPKSIVPEKTEQSVIQQDPIVTQPKPSNTKPTLSIPKQVTQEATGPSGANVAFSTSSSDKEDGSLTPVCSPSSGSTFPIGATSVSCTVTDSNNNSVSGSFTITVRDTTPPAFAPFQPTEGVRDDTGVQVFFDVTANDLVDGNVPVGCNYQSGYKFPPGVTELKCTTSDSRGNQSTKTVQITVTVTESGQ